MQPNLQKLGRIYTTLSLAVLPVALVVMFTYLYTFEEHGPQSQGLPALAIILGVILGFLGINTLAATLLSLFVKDVRPKWKSYLYTLLAMSVVGGIVIFGFIRI
jgi:cytochrome c biogenesis protein CcdA